MSGGLGVGGGLWRKCADWVILTDGGMNGGRGRGVRREERCVFSELSEASVFAEGQRSRRTNALSGQSDREPLAHIILPSKHTPWGRRAGEEKQLLLFFYIFTAVPKLCCAMN